MNRPLDLVWSPLAVARLREIRAFIALDKPEAAERLAIRMVTLVETLRRHPRLGHPAGQPGLREIILAHTPYVIVYRIRRGSILISTIHHSSRQK